MQTADLSPAVKYLVNSANGINSVELEWELESFDGPCAVAIIEEALENLDHNRAHPVNIVLLRRRVRALKGKAKSCAA